MKIFHNMIYLMPEERQALIALQNRAETVVPHLKESLSIRLSNIIANCPEHPELLAKALSYWFANLFHHFEPRNQKYHTKKNLVSIQLLVACLDVFLNYGQTVTTYYDNPQYAYRAFNKLLCIRMLEQHIEDSINISHLYEICLLY